MQFYDPNWKQEIYKCKKCKWWGEAIEAMLGKTYRQILELQCPQCQRHIGLILIDNVPDYYYRQDQIQLDTYPSYGGYSLKENQGLEEWEKYVIDFEETARPLKGNLFNKYFDVGMLNPEMEILEWSVIGKRTGFLRGKISHKDQTLAIFPMQHGDPKIFLFAAYNLSDYRIKDIIPTELAFSVMCGNDPMVYKKINMARVALQYAPFW